MRFDIVEHQFIEIYIQSVNEIFESGTIFLRKVYEYIIDEYIEDCADDLGE